MGRVRKAMFRPSLLVSNILLYSLILPFITANPLSSFGDDSFQQVQQRNEDPRRNFPRSPSIQGIDPILNDGIGLAIGPSCESLSAVSAGELNTGIDWEKIDTVVAFGDSFTQVGNGGNGSPPSPIRFVGKNPSAGGRNTNGETWIGQLIHFDEKLKHPRRLLSYAQTGATTDKQIWASRMWADDFPSQLSRFYANNTILKLNPATTLYVGYFGINDFWSISKDGHQMKKAGNRAAHLIRELHEYAGATNILWLGVQFRGAYCRDYNRAIWSGLKVLHQSTHGAQKVNFAYVDLRRFWSTILDSYTNFGYTSTKHCLEGSQSSIEDECEDPNRTVFYMGAHPSRQTHLIMAEYVNRVMKQCLLTDSDLYASLSSAHHSYLPLGTYLPSGISLPYISFLALVILALVGYKPVKGKHHVIATALPPIFKDILEFQHFSWVYSQ